MSTHSAFTLSFSLATLLATVPGCSSGDAGSATSSTAESKPTGAAAQQSKSGPGAPAATTAAAAAVALTLSATCATKYKDSFLSCNEFYGKIPEKAEAECVKDGGTFTTGTTPCTTVGGTGKCEKAPSDGTKLVEVSYKTSVGDPKGSCELLGRKWTDIGK